MRVPVPRQGVRRPRGGGRHHLRGGPDPRRRRRSDAERARPVQRESYGRFDASVEQISGGPRTSELEGLDAVDQVHAATFVFGAVVPQGAGLEEATNALVFAGSHAAFGTALVDGREPDPAAPDEFAATRSFVRATGASLGDRFDLWVIPQGPADVSGFDAADQATRLLRGTLVGIVDGPSELQDGYPLVAFPAGVLDLRDVGDVGVSATVNVVSLEPGSDARRPARPARRAAGRQPVRHRPGRLGAQRGPLVGERLWPGPGGPGRHRRRRHDRRGRAAPEPPGTPVGGRAPRAALDGHDPWPGRGGSTARCSRFHGGRGRGRRRSRLPRVRPLPHRLRPPRRARSRPPVRDPGAAPRRLRRRRPRPRMGVRGDRRLRQGAARCQAGVRHRCPCPEGATACGHRAPSRLHPPGPRLHEAEGRGGGRGGRRRRAVRRRDLRGQPRRARRSAVTVGPGLRPHPRPGRRRAVRGRPRRARGGSRRRRGVAVRHGPHDGGRAGLRRHGRAAGARIDGAARLRGPPGRRRGRDRHRSGSSPAAWASGSATTSRWWGPRGPGR